MLKEGGKAHEGWAVASLSGDSLLVGTFWAVSADCAVLETLGEKMMDEPGYSEGKNG